LPRMVGLASEGTGEFRPEATASIRVGVWRGPALGSGGGDEARPVSGYERSVGRPSGGVLGRATGAGGGVDGRPEDLERGTESGAAAVAEERGSEASVRPEDLGSTDALGSDEAFREIGGLELTEGFGLLDGAGSSIELPHVPQNRTPSRAIVPQLGQKRESALPQLSQKRWSPGLSWLHWEQMIADWSRRIDGIVVASGDVREVWTVSCCVLACE